MSGSSGKKITETGGFEIQRYPIPVHERHPENIPGSGMSDPHDPNHSILRISIDKGREKYANRAQALGMGMISSSAELIRHHYWVPIQ
jgi:hypothetical protein